jgi:hypothetical protein
MGIILADDFNDNSLDTNKWTEFEISGIMGYTPSGSCLFEEANQRAEIQYINNKYCCAGIKSKNKYKLDNGGYVEIENVAYVPYQNYMRLLISTTDITTDLPELETINLNRYLIAWRYTGLYKMAIEVCKNGVKTVLKDADIGSINPPRRVKVIVEAGEIKVYVDVGAGYALFYGGTYDFVNTEMYAMLYDYSGGDALSGTTAYDNFLWYLYEEEMPPQPTTGYGIFNVKTIPPFG